ncbi:hypothetical protein QFZ76_004520 [Streptomyces sp. V4I2]|nr:hypothetical protein [Streptomyces sp. V4I2]
MAADQKGAVSTRAWIVFLDESGVPLLPQVRRTYAPRGRTPLRHRLNWKRAWVAGQDWLTVERLPDYAPELNPVELQLFSLKKGEFVNLARDHLADVADATEQGIHRINRNPQLSWSFLTRTA